MEFPIADRGSGRAKDYTNVENWGDLGTPKTGGRTVELGFDLWIRLSNGSGGSGRLPIKLQTVSGRTRLIFAISGRTRRQGSGLE